MSDTVSHEVEENTPRFEPWLAVLAAAFVPAALMVVLPASLDPLLIIATVVLLLVGIAMLVIHSRKQGRDG